MDPDDVDDRWIASHVGILAPDEAARGGQFALERLRHEYFCTRIMQRQVLSRRAPVEPSAWRFGRGPQGKPAVDHPEVHRGLRFNLSHTRGLIAMALCRDAEVGVDVETLDRATDTAAVARRFFSSDEAAFLATLDDDDRRVRFFELWTLKEACLKALGTGLALPLDGVRFQCADDGTFMPAFTSDILAAAGRWMVETAYPTAKHVLGLAVLSSRPGFARRSLSKRTASYPEHAARPHRSDLIEASLAIATVLSSQGTVTMRDAGALPVKRSRLSIAPGGEHPF